MNRAELISKLPKHLRELAERYLPAFIDASRDELANWMALVASGEWEEAYSYATRKLSTKDLVAEQGRLNSIIADFNSENARQSKAMERVVYDVLFAILTIGITAAKES